MDFYIGSPMHMNGKDVTCRDSDCDDWPSWLIEGKTYVTATCWQDTTGEAGKWYGLSKFLGL